MGRMFTQTHPWDVVDCTPPQCASPTLQAGMEGDGSMAAPPLYNSPFFVLLPTWKGQEHSCSQEMQLSLLLGHIYTYSSV